MKRLTLAISLCLLFFRAGAQVFWQQEVSRLPSSAGNPIWKDTTEIKQALSVLYKNKFNIPQEDSIIFHAIKLCNKANLASWEIRILNFWSQIKLSQDESEFAHYLIQRAINLSGINKQVKNSVDYRDAIVQKVLTHLYKNQLDSTIFWADVGIKASSAVQDYFNESVCTVQKAICISMQKGDTVEISSLFRHAYDLSQKTGSLHDDAMVLHNYAYYQKAYPVQNLKASLEALLSIQEFSTNDELASNKNIPTNRSPFFFRGTHLMMLRELAYGYLYLGDFTEAVNYIEQCTKFQQEQQRWSYVARILIEQTFFETYINPYSRIKELNDSVVNLSVKYSGKKEIPVSFFYYVQGWLSENKSDWQPAINSYKKATQYGEPGVNENHVALFRTYIKAKDEVHADSMYYAITSNVDSTLIQYYKIYFYKELPEYYRLKQDEQSALLASVNYYHLKDSMAGISSYLIASKFEKLFKTKEKDRLLVLAEKEKRVNKQQIAIQKKQTLFLSIGFLLLLLASILLIRNYRIKKKHAAALEQKNNQIETLIRELHHRVKNNLQVVSGLLSLQSNRLEDEAAKQAMDEGRTRVDAMAMIHQKLYMDKDLAAVDIKEYLENLSLSLASSFGYDENSVETTVELPSQSLDIDRAIPIGLIVNELITNAFKHAFEGVQTPRIKVSLSNNSNGVMELVVADNGKGISAVVSGSKSFGMKLVHTLVEQLNGSILQKQENGTIYSIQIRA